MIPYVFIGCFLARNKIFEKIKKQRLTSLFYIIVITAILFKMCKHINCRGFGYQGFETMLISLAVILFFKTIPFECFNMKINNTILIITKYTLGIYCCNAMIGKLLLTACVIPEIMFQKSTLSVCISLYIISYLLSYTINKIPIKICKMIV